MRAAAVLATGAGRSTGGFDVALQCLTSVDCQGVLTADVLPSVVEIEAFESNKFAGVSNQLSFVMRANVPLHFGGTMVTVRGLASAVSWPSGDVPLVDKTNILTRIASCDGLHACTLSIETSIWSGATTLSQVLSVTVTCRGFVQLHAVHACSESWGQPLPQNPCSKADTKSFTMTGQLSAACRGRAALIEIAGKGKIAVSVSLRTTYAIIGGGSAKWDAAAGTLILQVPQNLTQGSVSLNNPKSFAFSVALQNRLFKAPGVTPFVEAVTGEGRMVMGMAANRTLLEGGLVECRIGELLAKERGAFPPGDDMMTHRQIDSTGRAACVVIIKPPSRPPGWLLAAQVTGFGLRRNETLSIYNGDSPASPLLAILTTASNSGNDPRIFFPDTLFWSTECALSLLFTATGAATARDPLLEGTASSSTGFALRYYLQHPEKINHIR